MNDTIIIIIIAKSDQPLPEGMVETTIREARAAQKASRTTEPA